MDNTRHKARRTETTTPEADATRRVYRALKSLAHAEAELFRPVGLDYGRHWKRQAPMCALHEGGREMKHDCGNCNHHWQAESFEESCPECRSWYVMTTDEWSEQDAREETETCT
jgi:hypothetical protein